MEMKERQDRVEELEAALRESVTITAQKRNVNGTTTTEIRTG